MRLESPLVRQKQWEGPAILNFQLGAGAAGFYFLIWTLSTFGEQAFPAPAWVKLAGPGMVLIGLLGVALESRSPFASLRSLRNQAASWMSREALLGSLFIMLAVYDFLFPQKVASAAAALFSLLFALAQGFVLYGARGILAWNTRIMPFLFTGSSLLKGGAIIMILMSKDLIFPDLLIRRSSAVLMIMTLCLLVIYLSKRTGEFRNGIKILYRPVYLFLAFGFTFMIPGILLFAIQNAVNVHEVFAISGILMLIGTTGMISGLLKSGYYRPLMAGKPRKDILEKQRPDCAESPLCRIIPIEAGKKRISIK